MVDQCACMIRNSGRQKDSWYKVIFGTKITVLDICNNNKNDLESKHRQMVEVETESGDFLRSKHVPQRIRTEIIED